MPTSYTSLLGFALPVTGELQGTWGTTVNDSITELVEDSIAATATASVTSGNWTLSTTGSGSANEARCAILIPTGTPGVSRNVIVPSQSKAYIVINQSDAAVVLKGSATTGVTIGAGDKALCAWNGSDFVRVGASAGGSNTQVQFNSSGNLAGSANLTFDGTTLTAAAIADSSLTSGRVTYAGASGNLTDSTNLTFDGTTLTAANFADSSLTSGRVTYATTNGNLIDSASLTFDGTKLSVGGLLNSALTASKPVFTDASKNLVSTGTLGVDQGGTGQTSLTLNNVILGNGGSAVQFVAPGTNGNVLTSNGTTWASVTPAASGVTKGQSIAFALIFGF